VNKASYRSLISFYWICDYNKYFSFSFHLELW
jgi:hypothetical protein